MPTNRCSNMAAELGIWRLQAMFDEFGIGVTFFGCARAFELNPEVGSYISEAGHDVCCHGLRWEDVSQLDRDTERAHLHEAVASITATCGSRPVGWYAKAPPSLSTRELLIEEGGFLYDSDSFADDLPYFVEVTGQRHLVVPYTFVTNDSRYPPRAGLWQPHGLPGQLPAGVRRVVARGRRACPSCSRSACIHVGSASPHERRRCASSSSTCLRTSGCGSRAARRWRDGGSPIMTRSAEALAERRRPPAGSWGWSPEAGWRRSMLLSA